MSLHSMVCWSLLPVLATGCLGPIQTLYPPAPGERVQTVYLVTRGAIHTGIALERAEVPAELWAAKADYPEARYLEAGWGDYDGFRKDLTVWIAIKALCWPTRSILQLDGFTNTVTANFDDPDCTIIEIQLSQPGFERLCQHISKTHVRDEAGRPVRLGEDWYAARGRYCAFKTCNTWVAQGLRAAGCPVTPAFCMMRGPLINQARKFGRVVREPKQAD